MSLWKAQIKKAINSSGLAYKWSNTYFVEAETATEALSAAANIWLNGERLFHNQLAFAYEFYVNNTADPHFTPGTVGTVLPEVRRGLRPATVLDVPQVLPSFNVVRVDYPVPASRPSRKFYRVPLLESDVSDQQVSVALAEDLQEGANYIASLPAIRDPDGQPYGGVGVNRGITSRRLGREAALAVPTGPAFG